MPIPLPHFLLAFTTGSVTMRCITPRSTTFLLSLLLISTLTPLTSAATSSPNFPPLPTATYPTSFRPSLPTSNPTPSTTSTSPRLFTSPISPLTSALTTRGSPTSPPSPPTSTPRLMTSNRALLPTSTPAARATSTPIYPTSTSPSRFPSTAPPPAPSPPASARSSGMSTESTLLFVFVSLTLLASVIGCVWYAWRRQTAAHRQLQQQQMQHAWGADDIEAPPPQYTPLPPSALMVPHPRPPSFIAYQPYVDVNAPHSYVRF